MPPANCSMNSSSRSPHIFRTRRSADTLHVVEAAPWRARVVDELKDQHAELLNTIRKIAGDACLASQSRLPCETVWKEFAEFLHRFAEHKARENRLVQEVYVLDIEASD